MRVQLRMHRPVAALVVLIDYARRCRQVCTGYGVVVRTLAGRTCSQLGPGSRSTVGELARFGIARTKEGYTHQYRRQLYQCNGAAYRPQNGLSSGERTRTVVSTEAALQCNAMQSKRAGTLSRLEHNGTVRRNTVAVGSRKCRCRVVGSVPGCWTIGFIRSDQMRPAYL